MTRLGKELAEMIEERIGHPCEVYYERSHSGGWMVHIPGKMHVQRLGYNVCQARFLITTSDWDWIKYHLEKTNQQ